MEEFFLRADSGPHHSHGKIGVPRRARRREKEKCKKKKARRRRKQEEEESKKKKKARRKKLNCNDGSLCTGVCSNREPKFSCERSFLSFLSPFFFHSFFSFLFFLLLSPRLVVLLRPPPFARAATRRLTSPRGRACL